MQTNTTNEPELDWDEPMEKINRGRTGYYIQGTNTYGPGPGFLLENEVTFGD